MPDEDTLLFEMLIYTNGDIDKATKALDVPRSKTLLNYYLTVAYNKFTNPAP